MMCSFWHCLWQVCDVFVFCFVLPCFGVCLFVCLFVCVCVCVCVSVCMHISLLLYLCLYISFLDGSVWKNCILF